MSLDYLAAKNMNGKNLERLAELEQLGSEKKQVLYNLIDTYIRDAKARLAYAS